MEALKQQLARAEERTAKARDGDFSKRQFSARRDLSSEKKERK